jgi:hypothetical protein
MKTIKSPYIGRMPITARDKAVRLFQIKQILNRHRDLLIDRLLSDIPLFLAKKYKAYATTEEIKIIRGKLYSLKSKDIDLNRYASLINEIKRRTSITLHNDFFLEEIDQLIIG